MAHCCAGGQGRQGGHFLDTPAGVGGRPQLHPQAPLGHGPPADLEAGPGPSADTGPGLGANPAVEGRAPGALTGMNHCGGVSGRAREILVTGACMHPDRYAYNAADVL